MRLSETASSRKKSSYNYVFIFTSPFLNMKSSAILTIVLYMQHKFYGEKKTFDQKVKRSIPVQRFRDQSLKLFTGELILRETFETQTLPNSKAYFTRTAIIVGNCRR